MQNLIECVPNFSEGRRPEVVDAIVQAIAAVPGVQLLDREMDASHNRCVITFVAPPESVVEAAFAGIGKARELIDLTSHQGEHPRMGAADVVPFIPLGSATEESCVALARALGERVGRELEIPVFLYEAAATRPERVNLADVRKGQFEGLRELIGTDPARDPDFGPKRIHPTAGAVAIGARLPLVAFNVNLATPDVRVAKEIAKAVRFQTGGLRFVKALGFFLEDRGIAQVSMNLVNTRGTPIHRAFQMVKSEAARHGVQVIGGEVVGLVPQEALLEAAEHFLQLEGFTPAQVLENRLAERAEAARESLQEFAARVAAPRPTPGGGAVSALAGSLAAALGAMVCNLTVGRKKYASVEEEMFGLRGQCEAIRGRLEALVAEDSRSYEAVLQARKLPSGNELEASRKASLELEALWGATRVPLETAQVAAQLIPLAGILATRGNYNARSDAGVALLLAQAAVRGALLNVGINLPDLPEGAEKNEVRAEAARLKLVLRGADDILKSLESELA